MTWTLKAVAVWEEEQRRPKGLGHLDGGPDSGEKHAMFQSGDEFSDDLDLDTASASGFRKEEPENSALNSTTQNVRRLMASATGQQSTSNFIFHTV